jgi:hypothetical protein
MVLEGSVVVDPWSFWWSTLAALIHRFVQQYVSAIKFIQLSTIAKNQFVPKRSK